MSEFRRRLPYQGVESAGALPTPTQIGTESFCMPVPIDGMCNRGPIHSAE